eukprot:355552-Chlamydomonas_euryale.AAC.2
MHLVEPRAVGQHWVHGVAAHKRSSIIRPVDRVSLISGGCSGDSGYEAGVRRIQGIRRGRGDSGYEARGCGRSGHWVAHGRVVMVGTVSGTWWAGREGDGSGVQAAGCHQCSAVPALHWPSPMHTVTDLTPAFTHHLHSFSIHPPSTHQKKAQPAEQALMALPARSKPIPPPPHVSIDIPAIDIPLPFLLPTCMIMRCILRPIHPPVACARAQAASGARPCARSTHRSTATEPRCVYSCLCRAAGCSVCNPANGGSAASSRDTGE